MTGVFVDRSLEAVYDQCFDTLAQTPQSAPSARPRFCSERPALIITIVLGVLTLAVLVLAFFASKFWHWAHVLVLVAFYFSVVGYSLLAARSLGARLQYQEQQSKALADLDTAQHVNDALLRGTEDRSLMTKLRVELPEGANEIDGVVQLGHEFRMLNRMRGRVWRNATPITDVDTETGAVSIGVPVPVQPADGETAEAEAPAGLPSLGLQPGAIVYVFEQGPLDGVEGGEPREYLGEFRVEDTQNREATLVPLDQLTLDPYAAERLIESDGPWIVYESMPADDRALFASLEEERLRALLPEATIEEYLRDGTPSTPDDPPERLQGLDADGDPVLPDEVDEKAVSYRYRRQLRDYALLLNGLEKDRAELVAREQAYESDIAKLEEALEGARQLEVYRRDELRKWQADFAAVEKERRVLDAHAETLLAQVDNARRLLDDTLKTNAKLAAVRASKTGSLLAVPAGSLDRNAL